MTRAAPKIYQKVLTPLVMLGLLWPTVSNATSAIGNDEFIDTDSGGSDNAQTLKRRREEAKQECETNQGQGGGLFGQGATGGLPNVFSQGLDDNLPALTQNVLGQTNPLSGNNLLGENIVNRLTPQLTNGLLTRVQDELPRRLAELIGQNPTGNINELLDQALGNIIPGVTQNTLSQQASGFPGIVQPALGELLGQPGSEGLGGALAGDLGNILQPLLDSFTQMLSGIPVVGQLIQPLVQSLFGLTSGSIAQGFNDNSFPAMSGLTGNIASGLANPLTNATNPQQLMNGILQPVQDALSSTMTNGVNSLLGPINNAISGSVGSLTNRLTNALQGPLSGLTGQLNNALTGPGGALGGLTGQLGNALQGPLNALTGSGGLGGPLDQISSIFDGGAIGDSINSLTNQVSQDLLGQNNPFGQLFQGLQGGPLEDLLPQLQDGLGSILGGGGLFGAAGFNSVPVHEVGELLQVTKHTDETTTEIRDLTEEIRNLSKEMKELQIQICTNLKVIRDIQLATEEKERVFDQAASRRTTWSLQNLKDGFRKIFAEGFDVSPINTGGAGGAAGTGAANRQPLFVQNLQDDVADAQKEAAAVLIEQVDQSDNINKDESVAELKLLEGQTFQKETASTMSESDRDDFRTDAASLPSDKFWESFLGVPEPWNDEAGSFLLAHGRYQMVKSASKVETELAYVANQGNRPIRECAEYTDDGQACKKWRVKTPGSLIGNILTNLLLAMVNRAINTNELREDVVGEFLKQFPTEATDISAAPPQQPDIPSEDPCPGPGACPETGYDPQAEEQEVGQDAFEQALDQATTGGGIIVDPSAFSTALNTALGQAFNNLINAGIGLAQNEITQIINAVGGQSNQILQTPRGNRMPFVFGLVQDALSDSDINDDHPDFFLIVGTIATSILYLLQTL